MTKKLYVTGAVLIIAMVFTMVIIISGQDDLREESIIVAGSSTFSVYSVKLAKAFAKTNPNLHVVCDGGGSIAGLVAVKRGAINIAAMSRDIDRDQDDEYTRSYLIAKDAIAIAVHRSNPIHNLSIDQARDIFSGKTKYWIELGGASNEIVVVSRKKGSKTRQGIEDLVMGGHTINKNAIETDSPGKVIEVLKNDLNAVGYVTLNDLDPEIKILAIDNIIMDKTTALSGRYPLSRSFYYVLYESPDCINVKQKESTRAFLNFALSNQGQDIIEQEGLLRVH